MADNKFLDQSGLQALWSQINATFARVRRDNDYNYDVDFIPVNKEICFVDTAKQGLRAKVGDGLTPWRNLPFADEGLVVKRGYFYNGVFYSDSSHTDALVASGDTIYIDMAQSLVYVFNNNGYVSIRDMIPNASAEQVGIIKLYDTKGTNIDGSITQRLFTEEINRKFEVTVDASNELVQFL